jgi:hypothetical protein
VLRGVNVLLWDEAGAAGQETKAMEPDKLKGVTPYKNQTSDLKYQHMLERCCQVPSLWRSTLPHFPSKGYHFLFFHARARFMRSKKR